MADQPGAAQKPGARGRGLRAREAKAPWPLEERPGFLLRRLHQAHVALFHELAGTFGVTPVQYSLLTAIAARGEADQTTLAGDVALDRSTAAATLARLAERGLIRRRRAAADGRARLCCLTRKGAELLPRIEPAAREAHRRTLERLTTTESAALVALLGRALGRPG
ncbi:MAG: MarR family transcriptional regulator [Rubritepida sp.]|jgi:DNA-binding MarR family transcriptional regulator|nr:MarR family transcriptional regulator [Rubritepida sp.]